MIMMTTNVTDLFSRDKCSVVWLTRKEHFMYDNLPSDPEFRRVVCRLKGIPYTDPEPPTSIAEPTIPEQTVTAPEIKVLVEMAVKEQMNAFEQRIKKLIADQKDLSL